MAWNTTRVSVTATPVQIAGGASTVLVTLGASPHEPLDVRLFSLAGRFFLSPTSAGTTANSCRMYGLTPYDLRLTDTGQVWALTSALSSASLNIAGGRQ